MFDGVGLAAPLISVVNFVDEEPGEAVGFKISIVKRGVNRRFTRITLVCFLGELVSLLLLFCNYYFVCGGFL